MNSKHEFIPCNVPLYTVYEDEGKNFTLPIIGFDVEHFENGQIEVSALELFPDGQIEVLDHVSNAIRMQNNPIIEEGGD